MHNRITNTCYITSHELFLPLYILKNKYHMLFQSLHTLKINIPSYSNNFIKIHEKSASALAILSSIKQLFEYLRPLGYKYAKTRKS